MTASVSVERPAAQVAAVLFDPARDPEWREDVLESALVSGEPGAAGAVYRERVRAAGREFTPEVELTEVTPGRLGFTLREPITGRGTYTLTESGGATQVDLEIDIDSRGGLKAMMDGMIAGAVQKSAERDLVNLKEMLEAS